MRLMQRMLPHARSQLHLCGQVLILRSAGRATLARDAFRHEGRALARPDAKSPTRGDVAGFAFEVHFVRNGVLLFLHEWLPRIPRLADLVAGDVVAALELSKMSALSFAGSTLPFSDSTASSATTLAIFPTMQYIVSVDTTSARLHSIVTGNSSITGALTCCDLTAV